MNYTTRIVCSSFLHNNPRRVGNTATDGSILELNRVIIAAKAAGPGHTIGMEQMAPIHYRANMQGNITATCRERLNGLCELLGIIGRFRQRGGKQFFAGREIDPYETVILAQ